ncbi:MAG TPA: TonB C-terminal domain-containing protein [Gemmatimonadales bacterium]|nr:TonB C-terminal domain-containing protein [Gemmatimonadales bacterium]
MRRRREASANVGLGLAGTAVVHGLAAVFLFAAAAGSRKPAPPTYKVRLIAAPAPTEEVRKAPEAVERPAEEKPAPAPTKRPPPKSTISPAAPPRTGDNTEREAAPRTTPKTAPLPSETPSTGKDVATVSVEGVEFPFPEYLQNIVAQVLRRWPRPLQSTPLEAEVSFFVHRDGSVSDLQFIRRSGNFAFDLEAQGAVEEVGRFKAFGPLPDGWAADVLFVRFYFSGKRQ